MADDIQRLIVSLEAQVAKFNKAMDQANGVANKRARAIESRFAKMNATLNRQFTGLAGTFAAGLGAQTVVREFLNFEQALTRINALVGVSREQTDAWREDLKRIAVETGRGPAELADALYFVTSAGLSGQDALDAVEASAKAAAVGLGEAMVVADVASSAVNAYAKSNYTSAQAVDVLVAAVREGKAEAPALAGALGQIIPTASKLGVSFDQVGAAVAAMTRTGTSADEAVTQLNGIFNTFLAPTQQAAEALRSVGLSAATLREELRERGLLATLELLSDRLGGNEEAIATVFGNVRALRGVFNLLGDNVEATRTIFANLATSAGDTNKALALTAEDGAFKLEQAWSRLKTRGIELAQVVLTPILNGLAALGDEIEREIDLVKALTLGFSALFSGSAEARNRSRDLLRKSFGIDVSGATGTEQAALRAFGRGNGSGLIRPPAVADDSGGAGEGRGGGGAAGGGGGSDPTKLAQLEESIGRRTAALRLETEAMAKSTYEAERLRIAQELLNQAKDADIPITDALRQKIDTLAGSYAEATVQLERTQQMQDLLKSASGDLLKGFISDLRAGASASEALSNALGKLADRLLDIGANSLINSLFGGGLGGPAAGIGGGSLGSIAGLIFHRGGVAGRAAVPSRRLPAAAFAGAPRLHNGLRADEMPAILQRGETVIPRGSAVGGGMTVQVVNQNDFRGAEANAVAALSAKLARMERSIPETVIRTIGAARETRPGAVRTGR